MARYKINSLNKKEIEDTIEKLKGLRKTIRKNVIPDFINESLQWIIDRANKYLDERDTFKIGINTTNIRNSWVVVQISPGKYQLRNIDENVAYVEFGTGYIGEMHPHEKADEEFYKYNVNNYDDEKGWSFYNKEIGIYFKSFLGYEGKSFLYDAGFDYFEKGEYKKIYQQVLERYIK